MAINMKEARTLCSSSELQLVRSATQTEIVKLTPARLRAKIDRARKLRDKFRDLARQQRRESRGKAKPRSARPAQGNEATRRKQEIFADALAAFEARLDKLAQAPAAKKTGGKAAGKTSKKPSKKTAKNAPKRVSKKTAKKVAKKASKKASKQVAKRAASAVTGRAGSPGAAPKKTSRKKRTLGQADTGAGALSRTATLIAKSKETRGVRAQKRQKRANLIKIEGHVSSRGRRNQAKRDSR